MVQLHLRAVGVGIVVLRTVEGYFGWVTLPKFMEQTRTWSFFLPWRYAVVALVIVALLQLNYFADMGGRIATGADSSALEDCNEDEHRSMSRVMRDEFVYSSLIEVPNSLSFGLYEAFTFDAGIGFRNGKMFVKGMPICQLHEGIQATKAMSIIVGGLTGMMMWAAYLGYAIFRRKPKPSFRVKCVLIGIILVPYLLGAVLISVLTA